MSVCHRRHRRHRRCTSSTSSSSSSSSGSSSSSAGGGPGGSSTGGGGTGNPTTRWAASQHGQVAAADGLAVGYLLGGAGVRGDFMGCNTFGFAYYDSTGGRELVVGFTLAADGQPDRYEAAVGCFERKGVGNCLEFGSVWRNSTLGAAGARHEL